jgi:hypothetical protein
MKFKTIDAPHLLNHFNGDEEILLDMIQAFQNGVYNLLNPIRDSIMNISLELMLIPLKAS